MKITALLFSMLFVLTTCLGQNEFKTHFTDAPTSSKSEVRIPFKDTRGNEGHLPIVIVKGARSGPVFTIVAGVHGYEYPPIVATQSIIREMDPKKLQGTLIIIPIANVGSFYTRTPYINPQDRKNLNNAFPGSVNGTITEQIANFITQNVIPKSDVFLDVHGGDACEDLIPFVCYYNNTGRMAQTEKAKELSINSGFQYVVSYPYTISDEEPAKYAFKQAVQDGKVGLSIECGKLGNVQEENVAMIKTGIYNMLGSMDMYTGDGSPHPDIVYRNDQTYINAEHQGLFYSELKAGDQVTKGQLVGFTTDEFGNILEEHKATKDGIILYKLATPPINVDDTVMCISSLSN